MCILCIGPPFRHTHRHSAHPVPGPIFRPREIQAVNKWSQTTRHNYTVHRKYRKEMVAMQRQTYLLRKVEPTHCAAAGVMVTIYYCRSGCGYLSSCFPTNLEPEASIVAPTTATLLPVTRCSPAAAPPPIASKGHAHAYSTS